MSDVANKPAATVIQEFLQKLYAPIYEWAKENFATKEEVAAATGASQASAETCESIIDELT